MRDMLRALLVVLVTLFIAVGLLYAYRAQGPGTPPFMAPLFAVGMALMWVLPIALIVWLMVAFTRGAGGGRAGDRYEALARIADLRDRGVLSADEFEREKKRILE